MKILSLEQLKTTERTKAKRKENAGVILDNSLFKRSNFDTKNYYFYYTEIWKDRNRPS